MSEEGKLVVISGPSGAGKSTIASEVRKRTGADFSVSATTRPARQGEIDGREYHFVDRTAFEKMIEAGELLEWAEVFGQLYGTPARPVREAISAGRTIVLDLDVQGGNQVYRKMPSATFVLIVPPVDGELARRLRRRATESPGDIANRLAQAKSEIAAATESGLYEHVVINDDLDEAVSQVVEIITGQ